MLQQKKILLFWLPLFASWLLMTSEGPIVSAIINRLPDEVVMLAAFGIVGSLSVMIESPIINLLATSTALIKDRATFLLLRRFTLHWMVALTAVSVLIAYTPLFDLVVLRLLHTPTEVAVWIRPGLKMMIFWSAAIAWRRFLQGVLIHFGQPSKMAWGTAVRLLATILIGVGLGSLSNWPGVLIGAASLMGGVIAEALFATVAIRPLYQTVLSPNSPAVGPSLTYKDVFWFHLPLAGTSLMILLVQPLVTSSLAKLDNPVASLAAWPIIFQILLMVRAAALAMPEAVIALSDQPQSAAPLRRFALYVAVASTLFTAVFVFSPLANYYIFTIQDMTAEAGRLAQTALALYLFFPGLTALTMWMRGMLVYGRRTTNVNIAMCLNLLITAVVLAIGVQARWAGLATAAAALNIALLCETVYLAWCLYSKKPSALLPQST